MRMILASWALSNNTSLKVYDVGPNEEMNEFKILIGLDENNTEWKDIVYNEEEVPGINWGENFMPLNQCIKLPQPH